VKKIGRVDHKKPIRKMNKRGKMTTQIKILGAAGSVTGSRFLLEHNTKKYLIDCGLFQGKREFKKLNWQPFPISPSEIDGVIITHAHIDHTGYLPRLVKEGFNGPVYATNSTVELMKILLMDSAHLQERDAYYANKYGYSKHKPALPLYTADDAQAALSLLQPVSYHQELALDDIRVIWRPAGHILGSAIIEILVPVEQGIKKIVFSGDLGRYASEIMKSPFEIEETDTLVMESTYGNRVHDEDSIDNHLEKLIKRIIESKGVLVIPAFTVGRTQQVLYHIRKLEDQGRIAKIPVFIDSPMAVDVSHLYCEYGDDHNLDVNLLMDAAACPLRCGDTNFVQSVEESKLLNIRKGPAVILSASGMCTGGRILFHLKNRLTSKKNAVLFVGYQPEGTRGQRLRDGVEKIRIHGRDVTVRAFIDTIDALSAHADKDELLTWARGFKKTPEQTIIVHGESKSRDGLKKDLEKLGHNVEIPTIGDTYKI
jgi:metallo-beta-lactamase family protein